MSTVRTSDTVTWRIPNMDCAAEESEIRTLLAWRDRPDADCGAVNALLDEHIGHIATRIRELRALEKQLRHLRAQCRQASATADCGILSGLAHAAADRPRRDTQTRDSHIHGAHR